MVKHREIRSLGLAALFVLGACDSGAQSQAQAERLAAVEAKVDQIAADVTFLRADVEERASAERTREVERLDRAAKRAALRDPFGGDRSSGQLLPEGPATPLPVAGSSSPSGVPRPSARPVPEPREDLSKLYDAIECEVGRCTLPRDLIDKLLADPAHLTRQARVIPAIVDGESAGMKFYGIRPSSLLHALGIKNGDMVIRVGEFPLTGPDSALNAYAGLRGAKEIEIELVRKGQRHTLMLTIE